MVGVAGSLASSTQKINLRRLVELRRTGGGDEGSGVGDERCGEGDGGLGEPGLLRGGFLCAVDTDIPSSGVYTRNSASKR